MLSTFFSSDCYMLITPIANFNETPAVPLVLFGNCTNNHFYELKLNAYGRKDY